MNIPVITLAALMAIFPLSGSAQSCWVTTGGISVEEFGELIEGPALLTPSTAAGLT